VSARSVGVREDVSMSVDIDDTSLSLAEIFHRWPEVARVFWRHETACVGCPIAPFHTVIDTCVEYHLDEVVFRAELRAIAAGTTSRRRSIPQDDEEPRR
jgi:hybrid cluster-associated redox disulfide protein